MGVSISVHEFDYDSLCNQFSEWVSDHGGFPEGRSLAEFEDKILPAFGTRYGDKFLMLWNEYYEDYNAAIEFLIACSKYIGHDEEDTPWFDYERVCPGANADEVLSEILGDNYGD
jgi:hypothetical protein